MKTHIIKHVIEVLCIVCAATVFGVVLTFATEAAEMTLGLLR